MRLRYPFWTLLALAAALCVVYVSVSMRLVGGELIPPLDDAFIHFQYARRLAEGAPFSYQAGDGYSSGATSLLWPAVLAVGYRLGFTGLQLYVWSLLVNTVLLAVTGTFTYRWLSRVAGERTALFGTVLLLTAGPFLWAAFSGMEVLLFATAMSAVLAGITRPGRAPGVPAPGTLTWAAVLATVRPEGALLAAVIAGAQVVEAWLSATGDRARRLRAAAVSLVWFVPVSLGAVQPLLNWLNTGLVASSSALAKRNPRGAHPDETVFASFVWDTALWGGYAGHFFGRAGLVVIVLFAVGAWTLILREREKRAPGVGAVGLVWWALPMAFLALFLPVGWHHYRYLIPYLVVMLPFVAIGAATVDAGIARLRGHGDTPFVLATLTGCLVFASFTWPDVLGRNARDIRSHQVENARWIAANLPPDAVVGANDVGALAYLGERRLVDLEGIVTPRLLAHALEGEGSVYERVLREDIDVFVVFPSWFVSSFKAGAFTIRRHARLEARSISGGDDLTVSTFVPDVPATAARLPDLDAGERILDTLNLSDRADEEAHAAWFEDTLPERGRANTVVTGTYTDGTRVVDSARRLQGGASLRMQRAATTRLVGRFGPSEGPSRLLVRVDGADVGVWELPGIAEGTWVDRDFRIPGGGAATIEIVPIDVARPPTGGWHLARLWTVGG